MTCIVGLVHDNVVTLGADSIGAHSGVAQVRADAKVFKLGEFAVGFTTSWRMGQVLRYHFTPPSVPDGMDLHAYMVIHFIEALRTVARQQAVTSIDKSVETLGQFLVGVRGRLFEIDADFQVGETVCPYAAVGAGYHFALGAMYATQRGGMSPRERITVALEASAEHSPWVRGPWHFVEA